LKGWLSRPFGPHGVVEPPPRPVLGVAEPPPWPLGVVETTPFGLSHTHFPGSGSATPKGQSRKKKKKKKGFGLNHPRPNGGGRTSGKGCEGGSATPKIGLEPSILYIYIYWWPRQCWCGADVTSRGQVSHYYTNNFPMTWSDVSFGRKNRRRYYLRLFA